MSMRELSRSLLRPLARKVLYRTVAPPRWALPLYKAGYQGFEVGRELWEWGWRSLVATPMFLSRCAVYGEDIAVDVLPYLRGQCRIELGSHIRMSGKLVIEGSSHSDALLRIGSGVFIGARTRIAVGQRVEIGDHVAIGGGCVITDTEGHSHRKKGPIWEDPPTAADCDPVIIEEDVRIGRDCSILRGVRVGKNSVIGAGSVLRSSVPPDSIVLGNPARRARWRDGD